MGEYGPIIVAITPIALALIALFGEQLKARRDIKALTEDFKKKLDALTKRVKELEEENRELREENQKLWELTTTQSKEIERKEEVISTLKSKN